MGPQGAQGPRGIPGQTGKTGKTGNIGPPEVLLRLEIWLSYQPNQVYGKWYQ